MFQSTEAQFIKFLAKIDFLWRNQFIIWRQAPVEVVTNKITGSVAGLFKNPGFSPKTQPSGFNWFKPGLTGFYGLNWVKLRMPPIMPPFWINWVTKWSNR